MKLSGIAALAWRTVKNKIRDAVRKAIFKASDDGIITTEQAAVVWQYADEAL